MLRSDTSLRRTASLAPAPAPVRTPERAARILAAGVGVGLLALALWPTLSAPIPAAPGPLPTWSVLAPAPEVAMRPWRWLVFSAVAPAAHLRVGPAIGDPARIEVLPAWRLQRASAGYPADVIVVAVSGRADDPACEPRLAAIAAELLRRIPTLAASRLGGDRHGAPPGLDPERLRLLISDRR